MDDNYDRPIKLSEFVDPAFGQRCIALRLTYREVKMIEYGFPSDERCRITPGLKEYATKFFARPEIARLVQEMNK